jgi:hypothetical protein
MSAGRLICAIGMCALLAACGEEVPPQSSLAGTDLCENDFRDCVAPVLSGQIRRRGGAIVSCMDSTCHLAGGTGGRFTLSATDMGANFQSVKAQVNLASADANESLLLIEPTQDDVLPSAVAGPHGGGEIFPTLSNQCGAALSRWIGIKVTSQADARCGICASVTPVTNTMACGY